MDARLRNLIRDFQQEPNLGNAQAVIHELARWGQIPENIQSLLNPVSEKPRLGFPARALLEEGAPEIIQEANRITWLEEHFSEDKFLWFIITRNLIEFVARQATSPPYDELLFRTLHYSDNLPQHFLSQHTPMQGATETILLRDDFAQAVTLLRQISPQTGNLSAVTLHHQIRKWEDWTALTAEEGYRNNNCKAGEDEDEYAKYQLIGDCVYTLSELLYHLFLVLTGRVGEPERLPDNSFNPNYTGSPFLVDFMGEHGTLNPENHLAFISDQVPARLVRLVEQGQINWFVVYSNALVGCYFAQLHMLKSTKSEPKYDMDRLHSLNDEYDELEARFGRRLQSLREQSSEHAALTQKLKQAKKRLAREKIEEEISDLEAVIFDEDEVVQDLRQAMLDIGDRIEEARENMLLNRNEIYERHFWQTIQPVLIVSAAEYLVLKL